MFSYCWRDTSFFVFLCWNLSFLLCPWLVYFLSLFVLTQQSLCWWLQNLFRSTILDGEKLRSSLIALYMVLAQWHLLSHVLKNIRVDVLDDTTRKKSTYLSSANCWIDEFFILISWKFCLIILCTLPREMTWGGKDHERGICWFWHAHWAHKANKELVRKSLP